MARRIIGSGGGGGGGGGGGQQSTRVAVESPDSLRSKQFARVLDVVSEGEIGGLVGGLKSVYLDDTPIENADGTLNFSGITLDTRNGTQTQSYITGFSAVENEQAVGQEVKFSASVARTISNANANAVRVTIGVPTLLLQNEKTGDRGGSSVTIAIDVQADGGGYVEQLQDTITGKTTTKYQRSYRIALTGAGPWDIRVRRLTADSTTTALTNKTYWDSYTEIIDAKLRHPNSALVGLRFDASQFRAIPTRGYHIRGIKVRIPSNYNPTTRAYTGVWDGTFSIAWTNNPAWCFYDLLTSERYGAGEYLSEDQIDKWSLYNIGQYCDELVPDGFGGMEPRFTCNIYIQTREDAFKLITNFASIFRGMAYWAGDTIMPIADKPTDATMLFTAANVIDGQFSYSGTSIKARHTVCLVTWNDPSQRYQQKLEYVEDPDGIAKYGVVQTDIVALGCTSRGQAHRLGKWVLFSERMETETVRFHCGMDGVFIEPGAVIKTQDQFRAGERFGGRIVSATKYSVVVDAPQTIVAGETYALSVILADGTLQQRTVSNAPGVSATLNVYPGFSSAPQENSMWVLATGSLEPETWRVISVAEADATTLEVVALAHNPGKYDAVENNLILESLPTTTINVDIPETPSGINIVESLYAANSILKIRASVSWPPCLGAGSYVATYQKDNSNASVEYIVGAPFVEFDDLTPGTYTVRIVAVNALGRKSATGVATQYIEGKSAPPSDVTGVVVQRSGDNLMFAWQHIADLDRSYYEVRKGERWASAVPVGSTQSNTLSIVSPRGGVFLVKAVDTSGVESKTPAQIASPDVYGINVVYSCDESSGGWNGSASNAVATPSGVIVCDTSPWSAYTGSWDSYTDPWVFLGDSPSSGVYVSEVEDVGFITTAQVALDITVSLHGIPLTWDKYTDPWIAYAAPTWTWNGRVDSISADIEIQTSNDNVTWGDWQIFVPGAYTMRYLRYRVTMRTTDTNFLPELTNMISYVDVPDRVLHFGNQTVPSGGLNLPFDPPFVGIQTVQVTLLNAAYGDNYTVTNKSTSGVTINVFDSAGNPKAGLADIDPFGYGEIH